MSTALAPLWAIEDELIALLDSVATCPEELLPELQQQVDAYLGQEVAKVDQIAHVLSAMEYEQKAASDEIARLQERKKAAAKAQERLEQYVCRIIQARGVKALKGKLSTLAVRPSDAVVITDAGSIASGYKTATVKMPLPLWDMAVGIVLAFAPPGILRQWEIVNAEESISAAAIKKALKAGEDVPGADLEFRSNLTRK